MKIPSAALTSRLRRRHRQLLSRLRLPPDALPGSLALTHRRCGKPSCHCADGQGHPLWSLTFMVERRKRVVHIPKESLAAARRQVDRGRKFKQAVAELFVLNAELFFIEHKQSMAKTTRKRTAP